MNQIIHPDFKLNDKSFTFLELVDQAIYLKENGLYFEKAIGNFIFEWLNNKSYLFAETSGSTGKPKKIMLQKAAMFASAKSTGIFFNLQPKDSVLLCLSADFIAGKMMLVRAMILGLHLDYVEPNSKIISDNIYDFIAMVPMQVENSISTLKKAKKVIIGGTSIPEKVKKLLIQNKINAFETYGMTETISHIALKKITDNLFTLLPNISIKLDNRNCLEIEAPKLNSEIIQTNDIAILHSINEFELLGRLDNVINSGGVKLFPEVIEKKLSKHIKYPFFIASKKDEKLGEKVILLIENKAFKIKKSMFLELEKYEIPKEVFYLDNFVYTETNKINRKETILKKLIF